MTIKEAEKEHISKFKKKPVIIGMFWREPSKVINNITEAIKSNKPYNEYKLLTPEMQKHYDNGDLLL